MLANNSSRRMTPIQINQKKFINRKYSNELNVKIIENQLFAFTKKFVQDVKNVKANTCLLKPFQNFLGCKCDGKTELSELKYLRCTEFSLNVQINHREKKNLQLKRQTNKFIASHKTCNIFMEKFLFSCLVSFRLNKNRS